MAENEMAEPLPGEGMELGPDEELPTPDEEITGAPVEEELATDELEAGSRMIHTVDEIPELQGLSEGDTITFQVASVSPEGDVEMIAISEPATEPLVEEEPPIEEGAPPAGPAGREGVLNSLIS